MTTLLADLNELLLSYNQREEWLDNAINNGDANANIIRVMLKFEDFIATTKGADRLKPKAMGYITHLSQEKEKWEKRKKQGYSIDEFIDEKVNLVSKKQELKNIIYLMRKKS